MKKQTLSKLSLKFISAALALILAVGLLPGAAMAASSGSAAGKITVSGNLNVRSSASTGSAILTALPNGSYVTLISKSGDWWKVEYAKGRYGYCHGGYISEVAGSYAARTSSALNVRTGPGTSYGVIGWLSSGEYVVVLSLSGGWMRVLFSGTKIGYVSGSYLGTGTGGTVPETGYKSVSLSVPSYKQFDSRWAYAEVGTSGQNIKTIGCATTCIAMSESYRTGTTIYPDDMEARLNYTAGGSIYWPSNYRSYTGSDYPSLVYSLLKSGKPVLIGLKNAYGGQHWVVITGYTGGASGMDSSAFASFTVNDPASSYRTTLQDVVNAYPYFYKLMYY